MTRIFAAASSALAAMAVPAIAQEAATAQGAAIPAARALPASTIVQIASDTEISSKKIEVGQKFQFFVTTDVVDNGVTVIPRGSKVENTVTFKTGKATGGKSGKFELSFDKIMLNGKSYAMRGTHRQEGKGNTVAAAFGSMLVSRRSAVMLPGQIVQAFTNEAIPY